MISALKGLRPQSRVAPAVLTALFPGANDFPWPRLVAGLFWAATGLWLASFLFMRSVPISGDEGFYFRGAKSLAAALTGRGSFEVAAQHLVEFGFLMPGVSIALLPLFIVSAEPDLALVRAYASIATFMLWLAVLREGHRTSGKWVSGALLIVPPLLFTWQLFTATIWADAAAGLILALVFFRTSRLAIQISERMPPSWSAILALELLLVCLIYTRGNAAIIAVAIHIFLFALEIIYGGRIFSLITITRLFFGAAVVVVSIAPWSLLASKVTRDVVYTTTTVPLSLGITFGDKDQETFCFGPCPSRNIWLGAMRYAPIYAEKNNVSELEAFRRMSSAALQNLTLSHYLKTVRGNFRTFLFEPSVFGARFVNTSSAQISKEARRLLARLNKVATDALYFPFLASLILVNLMIALRSDRDQIASLIVKMFTVCIFLQPLVHPSHQRYWPSFAPLMSISAGYTARWAYQSVTQSRVGFSVFSMKIFAQSVLAGIQIVYVVIFCGVAAIIIAV